MSARGAVIWMTGLSGAGKSTLANALHERLTAAGHRAIVLDGDALRRGLNADLGFASGDRSENLRRVAHVAQLFRQQGFVAIVAVISPEHRHRLTAREIVGEGFVEVFVSAPLKVCEARDVKGLYARARRGEIAHFTGISGPFDPPLAPDVVIETDRVPLDEAVERLLAQLRAAGRLSG
ncbi:adenylyl-sulfate kinase [Paraburkholderia sp. BCC1884]|uniref:adenylyl-sulfate kinase n=1 Tax=Paraburkholderia sp. BCC1884 TaxID=2562668 RepID=UPI0021B2D9CF|nr:adenylyl-sulfate kinase [Paraburkholderia sp. BCC1884]